MNFTLRAYAPPDASGTLFVEDADILRGTATEPIQRITGLDTRTPWSARAPGLEAVDLNFEGYADSFQSGRSCPCVAKRATTRAPRCTP